VESACMTSIMSLRVDVRAHKASLTPPLFIEVSVPSQESERSCICVLVVSILPLSTFFSIIFCSCSEVVIILVFHLYVISDINFHSLCCSYYMVWNSHYLQFSLFDYCFFLYLWLTNQLRYLWHMLYIYILLIDSNLCCHHFIPVWYLELTTTYIIAIYDIWNIFKMHICQTSSQYFGINKILKITVFGSTYMNWHCWCEINVRENRRGNQEWTIQRHW